MEGTKPTSDKEAHKTLDLIVDVSRYIDYIVSELSKESPGFPALLNQVQITSRTSKQFQ